MAGSEGANFMGLRTANAAAMGWASLPETLVEDGVEVVACIGGLRMDIWAILKRAVLTNEVSI